MRVPIGYTGPLFQDLPEVLPKGEQIKRVKSQEGIEYLLDELSRHDREIKYLRRRVRLLEQSRDYWRKAARVAGWSSRWNR